MRVPYVTHVPYITQVPYVTHVPYVTQVPYVTHVPHVMQSAQNLCCGGPIGMLHGSPAPKGQQDPAAGMQQAIRQCHEVSAWCV